jgi:hypothetical protein
MMKVRDMLSAEEVQQIEEWMKRIQNATSKKEIEQYTEQINHILRRAEKRLEIKTSLSTISLKDLFDESELASYQEKLKRLNETTNVLESLELLKIMYETLHKAEVLFLDKKISEVK